MKNLVGWQTCNDLNKINDAIIENSKGQYNNWEGLRSAKQIISISYDPHLGCYIVFWQYDNYLV